MKSSERFEPQSDAEMSGDAVVQLLQLFDQQGIEVVVDGGWGVDALLGEQTRVHGDVDIALEHKDVPKLRACLKHVGTGMFPVMILGTVTLSWATSMVTRLISTPTRLILDGTLVFGVEYPLDSLTGTGSIQGYPVKCISVEWMVKFHSGYELDENDYHDVSALCERFGIALPAEYERFTREVL